MNQSQKQIVFNLIRLHRLLIFSIVLKCVLSANGTISKHSEFDANGPKQQPNQLDLVHGLDDNRTTEKTFLSGLWFNKNRYFEKCAEIGEHFGQQCSMKLLSQKAIDRIELVKPNYAKLMQKIVCTLDKLNCQSNDVLSFQIHDIPCQSSCFAMLAICTQTNFHKMSSLPIGCSLLTPSASSTQSQQKWMWNINKNNFYKPYKSNVPIIDKDQSFPFHSSHSMTRNGRRFARYPNQLIGPYHYNQRHHHQQQQQHPIFYPNNKFSLYSPSTSFHPSHYTRSAEWTLRRSLRQASRFNNFKRTLMRRMPNKQHNMAHYYSQHNNQPNNYYNNFDTFEQSKLHFSPVGQTQHTPNANRYMLTEQDCLLLPPGGCDKWSDHLTNMHQLQNPNFRNKLQMNFGCPADMNEICDTMFPHALTRSQWIKANFTVAAIIRISGTLWWFGKSNRFQPLFRFHVLKTFDSDIHPYDEKMILTYSWPFQCICSDEITIGKKYLMMTHSFKSRQTLHVSKKTVFLSRVKRYTKKLACWKGSCVHKTNRNRRRRYHPNMITNSHIKFT